MFVLLSQSRFHLLICAPKVCPNFGVHFIGTGFQLCLSISQFLRLFCRLFSTAGACDANCPFPLWHSQFCLAGRTAENHMGLAVLKSALHSPEITLYFSSQHKVFCIFLLPCGNVFRESSKSKPHQQQKGNTAQYPRNYKQVNQL